MRALKIFAATVIGVIALSTLTYAYKAKDFIPLEELRQDAFSGAFIDTPQGKIAYQWHLPNKANSNGETAVLIHGFSTPQFVFDKTTPSLVQAGFRVLTFDHLGRGLSDRPEGTYDADWYRQELRQLLQALKISRPVHLIGYSMGGANATTFSARHPEQVASLTLIAPAGFVPEYSFATKLLLTPSLGEKLMIVAGRGSLVAGFQRDIAAGKITEDILLKFDRQFFVEGTTNALVSTLRNYPMHDLTDDYQQAGKHNIKTTVIWGEEDQVVPAKIGRPKITQAIAHAKHFVIEGATHSLTYADSAAVNPLILNAIR